MKPHNRTSYNRTKISLIELPRVVTYGSMTTNREQWIVMLRLILRFFNSTVLDQLQPHEDESETRWAQTKLSCQKIFVCVCVCVFVIVVVVAVMMVLVVVVMIVLVVMVDGSGSGCDSVGGCVLFYFIRIQKFSLF